LATAPAGTCWWERPPRFGSSRVLKARPHNAIVQRSQAVRATSLSRHWHARLAGPRCSSSGPPARRKDRARQSADATADDSSPRTAVTFLVEVVRASTLDEPRARCRNAPPHARAVDFIAAAADGSRRRISCVDHYRDCCDRGEHDFHDSSPGDTADIGGRVGRLHVGRDESMIPKSGYRFSEKIMLLHE
jgi:hypothetical protein